MCCALTILLFLGPRILLIYLYLIGYLNTAYNSIILPCLGFFFLPWTTVAYAWSVNTYGGLSGLGLIAVILALIIDIGSYTGGAYGNRSRLRRR